MAFKKTSKNFKSLYMWEGEGGLWKEVHINSKTIRNNRYQRKFVSLNVINLSSRLLSYDEDYFPFKRTQVCSYS